MLGRRILLDTLVLHLQLFALPAVHIFLARARMVLLQHRFRLDNNLINLRSRLRLLEVELGRLPAFMRCQRGTIIMPTAVILLNQSHVELHRVFVNILYLVGGALLSTCGQRVGNVWIELAANQEVRSARSFLHTLSLRLDLVVVERFELAAKLERLGLGLELRLVQLGQLKLAPLDLLKLLRQYLL